MVWLIASITLLAKTAGAEAVEPLQNRREQPKVRAVHFVADSLDLDAAMKRRTTTGPTRPNVVVLHRAELPKPYGVWPPCVL